MKRTVEFVELVDLVDLAADRLRESGLAFVRDYHDAIAAKLSFDEEMKYATRVAYIYPKEMGYELRVVENDPAEEPNMSSVLALVAEAEEWGTTVETLAGRNDSTRKGFAGERRKRAEAAAAC